jgi:hypothetical protein
VPKRGIPTISTAVGSQQKSAQEPGALPIKYLRFSQILGVHVFWLLEKLACMAGVLVSGPNFSAL